MVEEKKKKYDLAVAYRIYPKISREPAIFSDDKFQLAKLCLKSFKKCLGTLKVKIWALLDDCPPEYEQIFKEYFNEDDLELIQLNGIGNHAMFNLQIDILSKQNNSEFIYFAEDDYFYIPNQFEILLNFLKKNNDADFVSPYDQINYYKLKFHGNEKHNIRVFRDKHWRTANCAYLTFLTTKMALKKTKHVFKLYSKGNIRNIILGDGLIWLCLRKYGIFNPFKIIKLYFKNRLFFVVHYRAWKSGWKQILFGKKWKLWCPIPSIATHIQKNHLAPSIKWEKLFLKEINELSDS